MIFYPAVLQPSAAVSKKPQYPKKRRKVDPSAKAGPAASRKDGAAQSAAPEDLALEEYDSDAASHRGRGKAQKPGDSSSSDDEDNEEEDHVRKIYYVSRTHTQLTQFIREARGTAFGKELRAVTLGSRSMLCVNEDVLALKSRSAQNDKCREMQEEKSKKKRCPYMQDKDANAGLVEHAKAELRDLEDIITEGDPPPSRTQSLTLTTFPPCRQV
jgi:hypothetical protein